MSEKLKLSGYHIRFVFREALRTDEVVTEGTEVLLVENVHQLGERLHARGTLERELWNWLNCKEISLVFWFIKLSLE
jgi:hypothetical protein